MSLFQSKVTSSQVSKDTTGKWPVDLLLTARRRQNSATPKSAFEKNSYQEQEGDNKAGRRYP